MDRMRTGRGGAYWQLLIFLLAAWVAVECPLSYLREGMVPSPWRLWGDALISILFTLDLRDQLEKQGRLPTPLDIAICIPFDLICWALGLGGVWNLLRLVRMYKIYEFFTREGILPRRIKVATVFISIGIIIHWIACAWMSLEEPLPGGNRLDFATQYNMALYWAVTTLTTIGYGDITPTSNSGRLFTILIMFLGVGVYGLVIGNISRITFSSFRHKEKMRERIHDLALLMRHYRVPKKVQREVFSYYHHLSQQRFTDNDYRILNELPHNLKQEMEIYMMLNLISTVPLFEGLSTIELKRVAQCLGHEFYSPGEFIIDHGEEGRKMFIISNGMVDLINEKNKAIATLKNGQCFGEVTLMMDVQHGAKAQASSYCDLYVLSREHFIELISKHSTLRKNIDRLNIKRKSIYQKAS